MALISCSECGKEISDSAKSCPHCGYPIESSEMHNGVNVDKRALYSLLLGIFPFLYAIVGGLLGWGMPPNTRRLLDLIFIAMGIIGLVFAGAAQKVKSSRIALFAVAINIFCIFAFSYDIAS